jgi:signal transduction histidine kinase
VLKVDPLAAIEQKAIAEEVASVLRHDLGNKLGAVRNAALYVRRRLEGSELLASDPRLSQFLMLIDSEAAAASELVGERLRLEQLGARGPRIVAAENCIRMAAEHVRSNADPAPVIEVVAEPGAVTADPHELALAVRCLLENAAEAAPGQTIAASGRAGDAKYVIEVSDRGSGIEESERTRVLQPFFSTKLGHIGLGLNVARRALSRYGGELALERGPGCRVRLVLPLADPGSDPEP